MRKPILGFKNLKLQDWAPPWTGEGFPGGSDGKESPCNVGDLGSIPGLGRSLEEGNGYPLQFAGLENFMDRGVWQATVHGVTKSRTRLSDFHFHWTGVVSKGPVGVSDVYIPCIMWSKKCLRWAIRGVDMGSCVSHSPASGASVPSLGMT